MVPGTPTFGLFEKGKGSRAVGKGKGKGREGRGTLPDFTWIDATIHFSSQASRNERLIYREK